MMIDRSVIGPQSGTRRLPTSALTQPLVRVQVGDRRTGQPLEVQRRAQPQREMAGALILPEVVTNIARIAAGDVELQRTIDLVVGNDRRAGGLQVDVVLARGEEQSIERERAFVPASRGRQRNAAEGIR